MKSGAIALGLLCWPIVWAYGSTVAFCTLLIDLLCSPMVALRRRAMAVDDAPPASNNASVIVLNYQGVAFLKELLPSLEEAVARAPGSHEIIVVDNGSSDGSAALVERDHPQVRLARLSENRFFIRGNRAGVEVASRDVLVFVNNDMRVEPDFLVRLLNRFGDADLFGVTARIEMEGQHVETGRTRITWRRGALHFVQVEVTDDGAPAIPAQWAGGGSSAFDRRKYEALGGFEDLYEPCYVEDVSLSYQAWRRGWHILFEPNSVVHHVHRGTSSVVFGARRTNYLERSHRELFFWRSVTDPVMVLSHAFWLPWNVIKDAGRLGVLTQVRALLATLPRLPAAWGQRQVSRCTARRTDREVLAIANCVRRHRLATAGARGGCRVVLSVGRDGAPPPVIDGVEIIHRNVAFPGFAAPSLQARLARTPRRYWNVVGIGSVADAVRDLLCEIDHDVVCFGDPWVLAATPPELVERASILRLDASALPQSPREERFLCRLARRVGAVACDSDEVRAWAGRLDGPTVVAHAGDALASL